MDKKKFENFAKNYDGKKVLSKFFRLFFHSFIPATNTLTKHLCLKKLLENLQRHENKLNTVFLGWDQKFDGKAK
jgi:hypothetical protein